MLFNRHDVYIGRSIGKYGEFSEGEVSLFAQFCRPGDIVVEVAPISARIPWRWRIWSVRKGAFMPSSRSVVFQTLCANVVLNSHIYVECRQIALFRTRQVNSNSDIDYAQENNFGGVELRASRRVHWCVARLDDEVDLPALRLPKADVEGMEQGDWRCAQDHCQTPAIFYVENDRVESPTR